MQVRLDAVNAQVYGAFKSVHAVLWVRACVAAMSYALRQVCRGERKFWFAQW